MSAFGDTEPQQGLPLHNQDPQYPILKPSADVVDLAQYSLSHKHGGIEAAWVPSEIAFSSHGIPLSLFWSQTSCRGYHHQHQHHDDGLPGSSSATDRSCPPENAPQIQTS